MSEEKDLKREGEELAKMSVESKLGAKQLRSIYVLAKTKPLPFVEASIQRQLARVSGTKALEMALGLLKKYEKDTTALLKVLMYANMLYDFYERQSTMEYRVVAEESAGKACQQYRCRYVGLEIHTDRGLVTLTVKVSGYRDDPKLLASAVMQEIMHRDPRFHGRVWIEQIDRR